MLEAIRYVDKVIPEEEWEQKVNDIKKYKIDIFIMGMIEREFDYLNMYCKVLYFPRTIGVSTSEIKNYK